MLIGDQVQMSFSIGDSTLVEHSTHNPKVKGSNPAAGAGREKMEKTLFLWMNKLERLFMANILKRIFKEI